MLTPMKRYPFERVANFRDLGGMPAKNGGMTRWGVFYRCAELGGATPAEIDFMYSEMNIRTVIDLRAPFEIQLAPDAFMTDPRFTWVNHSLIGDIDFAEDLGIEANVINTPTMVNFYKILLNRCPKEFQRLMTHLADGVSRGAVLFHCSAGKDRTGMTAMFLESLCGVPDRDIISQYEISRTLITDHRPDDLSGSHYANMEALLLHLNETYQSPTGYLRSVGVEEETLETIVRAFCLPRS